jgi:hypothetical protein
VNAQPPNSPLGSPPIAIDESLQAEWESATSLNIHKRKTNWNFYVLHCKLGNKEKVEWIEKFMRGYIAEQKVQKMDKTR